MTDAAWRFTLPWPPTVNHYWRIGAQGRPYIAQAGILFRRAVGQTLAAQRALRRIPALPASGPVQIVIAASPPDRRWRDLDNLLKATLDSLVHGGVLTDDSQVSDLRVVRDDPLIAGRLVVSVLELEHQHRRGE